MRLKILFIFLLFVVYFALSLSLENTNAIGLYLIISLGLFFWGVIEWRRSINRRNAENRTRCEEMLAQIPHTQSLLSNNLLNAILINEVTNILYVLQRNSLDKDFNRVDFLFQDILEASVIEDDRVLNLYPKEGLLGSTLVISEEIFDEELDEEDDEEEEESVELLCLKIVVDDLTNPIIEYAFIEDDHYLDRDSEEYIEARELCNEWYQKMCIIIKRYEHDTVVVRNWQ